ncbi:SET domain-containing protein SmydA-8-like isoform X2 [Bradysia coprophila]|uniref:SET domain-containing protein SmydA-8-like isoform X2 n=1 Tax=Bradysia coprophila TaxID=38358 RepID=UPI00187D7A05|nr:SET domain-containing protein SmydA-8-like isoform X2 [Bradysia coprophila]
MNEFENGKCKTAVSDEIGRYLIAAKNLKQGDLLLCEQPVIIGPYWGSKLCCLTCYKRSSKICKKCKLAPLCYGCDAHDDFECNFLALAQLPKNFLIDNFDVITPLRCIILSKNPCKAECYKQVMQMESHCSLRRGTKIWALHESCVIKPLMDVALIREQEVDLVQKYCGILDVNTFEVRTESFEEIPIRGLYPTAALLSHDCVSNTFIALDSTKSIRIYSSVDIAEGDPIWNNYTHALSGTEVRRQHLMEGKYFHCKCRRCLDPTELGTNLSSIQCSDCENGMTMFHESLNKWKCNSCNNDKDIDDLMSLARSEILEQEIGSVPMLEQLIAKYSKLLNPNHYLVVDMKQKLTAILRSFCDHEPTPQPKILQRKIMLCEEILPILRVIQPGISRLTGIALYEYFNSMVELTIYNMNEKNISIQEGVDELVRAETFAKESLKMLLYEPKSTPEGHLAKSAMLKLKSIRENICLFRKL